MESIASSASLFFKAIDENVSAIKKWQQTGRVKAGKPRGIGTIIRAGNA